MAMPFARANFQHKRGDTAILTGIRQFKAGEYGEAFYNLRAGLGRSPGNVAGRLLLARQIASGDSARAINLLEDGIGATGANRQILQALFSYYNYFQTRERALAKIDELLASKGEQALPADSRDFVVGSRAEFLLAAGRPADAWRQLAAINPRPANPVFDQQLRRLEIEALLRAERASDARRVLEQNPPAGPPDGNTLYLQAEIAIGLDDIAALRSALVGMRGLAPASPGPLLYAYRAWHRLKRTSMRDLVAQDYFSAFGADDAALQNFAAMLVGLDLPDVIAQVQSVAQAARLSPFAFRVHLTEIALRRGEFERATRMLRGWEDQVTTLQGAQKFYPEFLKLLTRAAFTGNEQSVAALVGHLTGSRGQAQLPICLLAVTVLRRAENLAAEQQVLRVALANYPLSDPLLAAQKVLSEKLAVASAAQAVSAAERAASAVQFLPPDAKSALNQIDSLLQADSLAGARDLLLAIRTSRPGWLTPQEGEFDLRELRLAFAAQDLISARTQLRRYLDRYRDEADALNLVRLAADFAAVSRLAPARVLHDELRARFSGNIRVFTALRELKLPDDLAAATAHADGTLRSLDQALDNGQLAQAERMLDYLRDKPPLWQASVKYEVQVREVRLRLALGQQPQALGAFRSVVLQPGAARSAAFRLVRETLGRGQQAHATTLAAEIVRLLPDDQAAAKLLKEVQAPVPVPGGP